MVLLRRLRDDGVGVIEYTEQLTYLLFLKMADERGRRSVSPEQIVPDQYSWQKLLDAQGADLEKTYTMILDGLARGPGVVGTSFRKAQNRIQDPAKLRRLIVDSSTKRTGRNRKPTSTAMPTKTCSPKAPPTRDLARANTSPLGP